ncbi:MAG: sugar-binding domain-containing protein [Propionicimonas sp.]|uniref:sugar-binding transcriptional regulator n=1 Tax=Propionicimonas sp. TaxID=1955623 RepID=UPI003D108B28
MSTMSRSQRARSRQMLEIARRYYLNDESMVSISDQLGVSRFKVARLLKEARETGLVRITLDTGGAEDADLAARLSEHLGLQAAIVVDAFGTIEEVRHRIGIAAGAHLQRTLKAGETLGLTWGRTLTHMIESLESLPNVQVLQLTGHVGSNLRESPIELARKASLIGGNNAKAIMAPLYVDNLQAAQALRDQPDIKEVFDLFDTVTTAIAAVGSFRPASDGGINSQFLPLLPPPLQERLLATGAIAEVCGLPFRSDGSLADPELTGHIFSISAEQLRRIPRVIAIASDPSKAEAILALWRADLISELVVDADLAETLLSLPAVAEVAPPR